MCVRELRVQYVCRADSTSHVPCTRISNPREAATLLIGILDSEAVEVFGLLCLTTTHRILCYHELARGTLDTVAVSPREIFKVALLSNSACVVVAHNHPSGDPAPSQNDRELTRRLTAAGAVMGMDVGDHVIVGHGTYYSFKESGLL